MPAELHVLELHHLTLTHGTTQQEHAHQPSDHVNLYKSSTSSINGVSSPEEMAQSNPGSTRQECARQLGTTQALNMQTRGSF